MLTTSPMDFIIGVMMLTLLRIAQHREVGMVLYHLTVGRQEYKFSLARVFGID
jgi:hypothetical protein